MFQDVFATEREFLGLLGSCLTMMHWPYLETAVCVAQAKLGLN